MMNKHNQILNDISNKCFNAALLSNPVLRIYYMESLDIFKRDNHSREYAIQVVKHRILFRVDACMYQQQENCSYAHK